MVHPIVYWSYEEYIRLFVQLTPTGRGSGQGRAQAEPSLTAWARPRGLESLSRRKPGPSRGFEPKPSPHITTPGHRTPTLEKNKLMVFADSYRIVTLVANLLMP